MRPRARTTARSGPGRARSGPAPGLAVALGGALLLTLTGCGQSRIESYCSDLSAHRREMADMIDSSSSTALLGHLSMLHDLADKAPEDLTDEWQTFVGALDNLDAAIRDAGLEPSDFHDGKPPDSLGAGPRKSIADAADQVRAEDVVRAAGGIEQQARDVCKINLGL